MPTAILARVPAECEAKAALDHARTAFVRIAATPTIAPAQRLVAVHSTPVTRPQPGKSLKAATPWARPPCRKSPNTTVPGPVPREPLEKLNDRYVEMVPEQGPGTQTTSGAVSICRFENVCIPE